VRTGVFLDGQNVTIGARYAFGGDGATHPVLLARELAALAGARIASDADSPREAELVEVRYVTGIPDQTVDPERHNSQRRRHDLMVATDVVVLEKPLRYRWEWSIRDPSLDNPYEHQGETRTARVKSRNRGQEKGIDVWLALDALAMCARADLDRVILVTADRDLDLVPDYLRMIGGAAATEVVQARVLPERQSLLQNPVYDLTLGIDRSMFELCRDEFDYSRALDEDEVARFVQRIGAETDGLRD